MAAGQQRGSCCAESAGQAQGPTLAQARLSRECAKEMSCVSHRQQLRVATPVSLQGVGWHGGRCGARPAAAGAAWGDPPGRAGRTRLGAQLEAHAAVTCGSALHCARPGTPAPAAHGSAWGLAAQRWAAGGRRLPGVAAAAAEAVVLRFPRGQGGARAGARRALVCSQGPLTLAGRSDAKGGQEARAEGARPGWVAGHNLGEWWATAGAE